LLVEAQRETLARVVVVVVVLELLLPRTPVLLVELVLYIAIGHQLLVLDLQADMVEEEAEAGNLLVVLVALVEEETAESIPPLLHREMEPQTLAVGAVEEAALQAALDTVQATADPVS
jgi:hypothetical protein